MPRMGNLASIDALFEQLSPQNMEYINTFLNSYAPSSQKDYRYAIAYVVTFTNKNDMATLTFKDYESIINVPNQPKSKQLYITRFFKYLYAYGIIKNESGLDSFGSRESLTKEFISRNKEKNPETDLESVERDSVNILNIEQILRLQTLADQSHEREKTTKLCFIWEILFGTDCSVTDLRSFSQERFRDGYLVGQKGHVFPIPVKYHNFLKSYLPKNIKGGFTKPTADLKYLGKLVDIPDLIPQMIKNTRKVCQLICSNCNNSYMNIDANWVSVQGRVICMNCANELKKKLNLRISPLLSQTIMETDQLEAPPQILSFSEQKQKISRIIDFNRLNQFKKEIGDLGEAYVYELELEKLSGTTYQELVDNSRALDPSNGYDILSFDLDGTEIYIEVKATAGFDRDFILTEEERKVAEMFLKDGKRYLVYRVENILAENRSDIPYHVIENIINNRNYVFSVYQWKIRNISPL